MHWAVSSFFTLSKEEVEDIRDSVCIQERMCINITQVGTKWHLKGFPINYSRLLFTLTLPETCTLNWCHVGTQPPTQSGVQTLMTVFFFCPRLQQPGINLREDLDSVNPTYFQATVRMKSFTLRWRVTARGEYNGRHYCHSQTFIMTEMEMMAVFFYPSEDPDLTMQRMEKLRMEKYKLYILISIRIECHSQGISQSLLWGLGG